MENVRINDWRRDWKAKSGKLLSMTEFDNLDDVLKEAIKRSYAPSVQNTALKNFKYGSKLKTPRKNCEPVLFEALKEIYNSNSLNENSFIAWEKQLAKNIRKIYHNNEIFGYTYGNAQKWINMAIKYLFSSNVIEPNHKLFEVCYLPIDSIIQQIAHKELGVKNLSCAWSKCDDWEEIERYESDIQKAILTKTEYKTRLWWECNAWKA